MLTKKKKIIAILLILIFTFAVNCFFHISHGFSILDAWKEATQEGKQDFNNFMETVDPTEASKESQDIFNDFWTAIVWVFNVLYDIALVGFVVAITITGLRSWFGGEVKVGKNEKEMAKGKAFLQKRVKIYLIWLAILIGVRLFFPTILVIVSELWDNIVV